MLVSRPLCCLARLSFFAYLLLPVVRSERAAGSPPPLPRYVGYKDISFTYELSRSEGVCAVLDCEQKGLSIRKASARIYYPTLLEEATEPDDEKDRDFDACRPPPARREDTTQGMWVACAGDEQRVTANPDAPLSPESDAYPVVLFSPGSGLFHQLYTALIQPMVRRGFVVVALSHPWVDLLARVDGSDVLETDRDDLTIYQKVALESADAMEAMDRLEELNGETAGLFSGRLALQNGIGYMGHSLGGASAMLTAATDSRISAALNMDGRYKFEGQNFADDLEVPWMLMATLIPWVTGLYWDGINAWKKSIPEGSVAFLIGDAGHLNFGDFCRSKGLRWWDDLLGSCGSIGPDKMDALVVQYAAAFFQLHLQNDEGARLVLQERNAEFLAYYYK